MSWLLLRLVISMHGLNMKETRSVIKTSQLVLYREIIAVSSEIHTEHIKTVWAERRVIKTSQLILYREIIAVSSEIHTEHINTQCGQNTEL